MNTFTDCFISADEAIAEVMSFLFKGAIIGYQSLELTENGYELTINYN